MSEIAYVKDGITYYTDGLASQEVPPSYLRRAIESVGIEKPSDYTLVLEEVERLLDERLRPCPFCGSENIERLKKCVSCQSCGARGPYTSEDGDDDQCEDDWNKGALNADLIRAASDLVQEMEEMGYGKTSDRALPGSWDTMVAALKEVQK